MQLQRKKYLWHFLFLFSLVNTLFQILGIYKIALGFNDINLAYIWAFITSMTETYFSYHYFEIRKVTPKLSRWYQFLLISIVLCSSLILIFKLLVFTTVVLLFVVLICGVGGSVSISTYLYFKQLSRLYVIGLLLFIISAGIFALSILGVWDWHDFLPDILFLTSSIEASLFTVGIMDLIKSDKVKVKNLEIEASTDRLTKLFNRSYFEKVVIPKTAETEQKKGKMSILMVDIDHFKHVNDTFGHNIGDVLLVEIAQVISNSPPVLG